MTQISLSKAYAIIDEYRGSILAARKHHPKGTASYLSFSRRLDVLNQLKKEFALVSDTDEPTLGL
jgi:hypothetical protein